MSGSIGITFLLQRCVLQRTHLAQSLQVPLGLSERTLLILSEIRTSHRQREREIPELLGNQLSISDREIGAIGPKQLRTLCSWKDVEWYPSRPPSQDARLHGGW